MFDVWIKNYAKKLDNQKTRISLLLTMQENKDYQRLLSEVKVWVKFL